MINKKERIAVLQILAIKEGLTSSEFNNVLSKVESISINSIFTAEQNVIVGAGIKRLNSSVKGKKNSFDQVLKNIKLNDQDKYQLLYELKLSIRSGAVLKNFNDVKDFLARIDQSSLITSSKSTTVDNALLHLSKKSTNEIRDIIKSKIRPSVNNEDRGFNELANYIIDPKAK